jgi:hypothetical protein
VNFSVSRPGSRMGGEVPMIELTPQQHEALAGGDILVRDAVTNETYVLIRREVFERMKQRAGYDDSPWTDEEMELLAWEAGAMAGWDDMGEYDHYPNKR